MGSSLARAIKKNGLSNQIVSSNRSDSINKKVIELKIVDDSSSDTKKMADGSDLIIIATPLSSYESVILKIKVSLTMEKSLRVYSMSPTITHYGQRMIKVFQIPLVVKDSLRNLLATTSTQPVRAPPLAVVPFQVVQVVFWEGPF